jgi:hypothetical protein
MCYNVFQIIIIMDFTTTKLDSKIMYESVICRSVLKKQLVAAVYSSENWHVLPEHWPYIDLSQRKRLSITVSSEQLAPVVGNCGAMQLGDNLKTGLIMDNGVLNNFLAWSEL